ncbi:sodium-dependent bicarbonate transport family permease [Marinicauda algicola]|uniref:Sodium-dependent bicarbonate transport family permease n=1 Tax=Marinicauda algicola TaxID=2029849 RepID=A0A4S2H0C5_9PROT|nr:sodium-dependent bicarbonate transport family permease [Marinicauda algicola]TGY88532.1 sodium-dependent bicarbonate transport family permease [Marinicauda algicola]
MIEVISLALANLTSPAVLFFALGIFAGVAKSDLNVPEAVAKGLALYLMLAIGFKGGVAVSEQGFTAALALAALAGIVLSFAMPLIAYGLLRAMTKLDPVTAAASAAHYGSISVVTFVAGAEFLQMSGMVSSGYMVAVLALMETPAILTGLILAGRAAGSDQRTRSELVREVALNGSVVLLLGSFLIGMLSGQSGMAKLEPFVVDLFQGVLALFLLDMGLVAARRLSGAKKLGAGGIAFGLIMPPIGASLALATAWLIGMSAADAAALMILAGSASYIAVPAAMRIALPQADPSVYLTLSLAITFPFNLTLGIPLYAAVARLAIGG